MSDTLKTSLESIDLLTQLKLEAYQCYCNIDGAEQVQQRAQARLRQLQAEIAKLSQPEAAVAESPSEPEVPAAETPA